MGKRLFLSNTNKMIGGVCGGLAEYMNTDPTIVRLLVVVVSLFALAGIGGLILYLIAWAIIPQKPVDY